MRKLANGQTTVRKRLRDALDVVVPDAQHQTEHLFSLSNASQFLFADAVLVIEGKTERKLLPAMYQSHTQKSLGQNKIAIISLDGTTNLSRTLRILGELDLPTKAIVDLDYAFTRATADGFLEELDPDLTSLKLTLVDMGRNGEITIDQRTQLPMKGIQGGAAEAYVLLAARADAEEAIERLHLRLLQHGIWLWTRGAIEPHLGLSGKNEAAWARFQKKILEESYSAACGNDAKALQLIDWIAT